MTKDHSLLAKISSLYYEHGLNQNEIAEICNISRSRISRLLLQAREMGIVQFNVVSQDNDNSKISAELEEHFHLKRAIVFDTLNVAESQLKKAIGIIASQYLSSTLKEGDTFAISWGETVLYTIESLEAQQPLNITVLPAIGGSDLIGPAYHVNEMVRCCVDKLGGIRRTLYSPAFVDSKQTRDAIFKLKDIQNFTKLWSQLDIALVGIGKSPFEYKSRKNDGLQFGEFYLNEGEQQELLSLGVMGDINGRFFGKEGQELAAGINNRIIGMSLSELKQVPVVIGVAGGPGKVNAIRAALRGGIINVLITDSNTAYKIYEDEP